MRIALKTVALTAALAAFFVYINRTMVHIESDWTYWKGHYGYWVRIPDGTRIFCDEIGPWQAE